MYIWNDDFWMDEALSTSPFKRSRIWLENIALKLKPKQLKSICHVLSKCRLSELSGRHPFTCLHSALHWVVNSSEQRLWAERNSNWKERASVTKTSSVKLTSSLLWTWTVRRYASAHHSFFQAIRLKRVYFGQSHHYYSKCLNITSDRSKKMICWSITEAHEIFIIKISYMNIKSPNIAKKNRINCFD